MSRIPYLAYGSNMWRRRIELRLGACELLGIAILRKFSLRFHKRGGDGSGKCDAYHTGDFSDTLYGVVYSLTRYQRDMLDEIEGPGYDSLEVPVRTRSGMLTAYTYVAKAGHVQPGLQPFEWYKSIVVAGARAHILPEVYVESLTTVYAVSDPDSERHAHHQAILDEAAEALGDD
jgi:gamma-glutamylcyclotransferase